MLMLHDTAYPRFKSTLTDKDLQEVYTPTPDDVAFAERTLLSLSELELSNGQMIALATRDAAGLWHGHHI